MVSSGQQLHFYKKIVFCGSEQTVAQYGFFSTWPGFRPGVCFVLLFCSTYGPVQTVGYSHEYSSRLVVSGSDECFQFLGQWLVSCPVPLCYLSSSLVEDKHVIVFIQYAGADVFVFLLGDSSVCRFSIVRCHWGNRRI